ncbi:hypothetical protein BDZ45DRAFT_738745 [Acephala macrosclerotiorum]|nr:hypothetical protein BDZ45DRAFT_738745 [Acephala macrosclerotiorum]
MARDHPSMKLERNILHVEKLVIALEPEVAETSDEEARPLAVIAPDVPEW